MTSQSPSAPPEEAGSPLPAIVVGVAILGVAAFLIFGSSGSDGATATRVDGPAGSQAASDQAASANDPSRRVRGGIGARGIDDAQGPSAPRINPAIRPLAEGNGLKFPAEAPKRPESFASKAEEIAYYEDQLTSEKEMLEKRQVFLDRVNRNILDAKTAEQKQVAESRGKIVQQNYDSQKEKVESIERRLAELRG